MLKRLSFLVLFLILIMFLTLPFTDLCFTRELQLKPHRPIVIEEEENLTKPGTDHGCRCVTGGSGTDKDPYVIEGWDIKGSDFYGMYITGISVPLVIKDVAVHHNGKDSRFSGIYMENVQNITIEKTTVANNKGAGIVLHESSNSKLIENIVKDNKWIGIALFQSNNNILSNNTVTGNTWGIRLEAAKNNTLSGNSVTNNVDIGMFLRGIGNVFIGNTIRSNGYDGINLDSSRNSVVIRNTICNNKMGISLYSSKDIVIDSNTICDNKEGGVYFEFSRDNLLINNKIIQNKDSAIRKGAHSINNRLINNTIEDKVKDKTSSEEKIGTSKGFQSGQG